MSHIYNDSYKFYRLVSERHRLNESEGETTQLDMVSAGNSSADRQIDNNSSSVGHQSTDNGSSVDHQANNDPAAESRVDANGSSVDRQANDSSVERRIGNDASPEDHHTDDGRTSAERRGSDSGTDWMLPGSSSPDCRGLDVPVTRAADDDKENTEPKGSAGGSGGEADTEGDDADRGGASKEPSEGEEKSSTADDPEPKPKKNRCAVCRKKVGLTGFLCRCGGLFCAVHRYSDKHDCTFDYRELGAQEIRRNNPVVVGEKIKKI